MKILNRLISRWVLATAILLTAVPGLLAQSSAYGPGRVGLQILAGHDHVDAGAGGLWNSRSKLHIQLDPTDGWRIKRYCIDVGEGEDGPPTTPTGNPKIGFFDFKADFPTPYENNLAEDGHIFRRTLTIDLIDDLYFQWGEPWEDERIRNVALFLELVKLDSDGNVQEQSGAWVVPELIVWQEEVVEADEDIADSFTGEVVAATIEDTDHGKDKRKVVKAEHQNAQKGWEVEEAYDISAFEGGRWGWWFSYEMAHPRRGHFIDSPVAGLNVVLPTYEGVTEVDGAFDYFPGERADLAIGTVVLGSALADHKISPLDVFEQGDIDDPRVINMARLLQSLDVDASPQGGINITPEVAASFEQAVVDLGIVELDFGDDAEIESVIATTIGIAAAQSINLVSVSAEDAKGHLDDTLSNVMFRKNVSKTPLMGSSKAKLATSTMWFPALKANGDPAVIEYFDEEGNLLREAETAKPMIITYTDEHPDTGAHDTWAAISRDDGNTWKRKNISRSADRSSFTLANGLDYYGHVTKPVVQFKGNKIMIAWVSKYGKGGKPAYSIDDEDDYPYDDPYYTDDIWGVGGPQRSHDYTEDGFPEVGELPFNTVWTARGIIATAADVGMGLGDYEGDIVWFKPERLTCGRRDAMQIFLGGAPGAGFALAWQEDPKGVRPGKFAGPGHGWSGATTNHKTDIWYSHITWGDFAKVDENFVSGGDPQHDVDSADAADPDDTSTYNRPKALVPMSLPVRLSDNDVINTHNILVELDASGVPVQDSEGNYTPVPNEDALSEDADGTHRYATVTPGLIEGWYTYINYQDESKTVAYTDDNRLLDGDTGASRVNLFLQPYVNAAGKTSAWAILNYEETKGAGNGPPEEGTIPSEAYIPEQGKNVIYHSFDFKSPDKVSGGTIANLPERDELGVVLNIVDDIGQEILDWQDAPQLAYENARRARFILQGGGAIAASTHRTSMLMVYKEGREGSGRPSDIMLRRFEVPAGADLTTHNPYCVENLIGTVATTPSGQTYYADGAINLSTVTPVVTTDSMGDPEQEDPYGAVKVVTWEQTLENFDQLSYANPYEDARAHRGQIRGDFATVGFSYTPNWAAARNGNDKYDFYIRRTFDGGQTWTTDPAGSGVTHCRTSTDPISKVKTEVCTTYAAGAFEEMRNLSQLPNAKASVIEPRIVAVPGTIKSPVTKAWTGIPEDKQNPLVYYVAYGTSTNPKKDPITGEQEDSVPTDLFYSFTQDQGESYAEDEWIVNPDSAGNNAGDLVTGWGRLAKGDAEQGEVQIRMTPDGSRFYSCWLDEGEEGSDIFFRRIMSSLFPGNVIQ